MNKLFGLFLLLASSILMTSCSPDSPKKVAEKFLNAFYHRDFKTAMPLATKSSREQLDMIAQFASEMPEASNAEAKKILIKMGREEITGDKATVYYTTSEGDIQQHINLVKENGKWLVAWSKMDNPEENKLFAPQNDESDSAAAIDSNIVVSEE